MRHRQYGGEREQNFLKICKRITDIQTQNSRTKKPWQNSQFFFEKDIGKLEGTPVC